MSGDQKNFIHADKREKALHSVPRNLFSFKEDLPSKTRKTFHFLKPAGFERSEK